MNQFLLTFILTPPLGLARQPPAPAQSGRGATGGGANYEAPHELPSNHFHEGIAWIADEAVSLHSGFLGSTSPREPASAGSTAK